MAIVWRRNFCKPYSFSVNRLQDYKFPLQHKKAELRPSPSPKLSTRPRILQTPLRPVYSCSVSTDLF